MKLVIDLSPPIKWADFIYGGTGPRIALDGYISAGPRLMMTPTGPAMNMNHHEDCDRFATRATCAQALLNIRMGLYKLFDYDKTTVFVNDCDQDVCLSWFLLKNNHLVSSAVNPLINALVEIVDKQDTCGGTYSFPIESPMMRKLQWIMSPYLTFRHGGGLARRNESEYRQIIDDVCHRISAYVVGKAEEADIDCEFEVIDRGLCNGVTFFVVKEIGREARSTFLEKNILAYVSYREAPKAEDGSSRWIYTIGKISPFVDLPMSKIYAALQKAENLKPTKDCWGGSDTIGGSPRSGGSWMNPEEVFQVLNELKIS